MSGMRDVCELLPEHKDMSGVEDAIQIGVCVAGKTDAIERGVCGKCQKRVRNMGRPEQVMPYREVSA